MTENSWSSLDKKIAMAEESEQKRKQASAEAIEKYLDNERRKELSKKNWKDRTWEEAHLLNELKKSDDGDLVNPAEWDKANMCFGLIEEMVSMPRARELGIDEDLYKVRDLLQKLVTMKPETPQIDTEKEKTKMTSYNPDVNNVHKTEDIIKHILKNGYAPNNKGAPYLIHKSDNQHISGYASVDILDNANERIPMKTLKKAIPAYLKRNSIIMMSHTARPVGRVTKHSFTKYMGHDALHIEGEIFDDEVYDQIGTVFKGLSLGGRAPIKKTECDAVKCWKEIPELDLWEISLCEKPCNPLAVLD